MLCTVRSSPCHSCVQSYTNLQQTLCTCVIGHNFRYSYTVKTWDINRNVISWDKEFFQTSSLLQWLCNYRSDSPTLLSAGHFGTKSWFCVAEGVVLQLRKNAAFGRCNEQIWTLFQYRAAANFQMKRALSWNLDHVRYMQRRKTTIYLELFMFCAQYYIC